MLPCFVFNSLPFEISDPTFPYPELRRTAADSRPFGPPFLTPFFSHSSKLLLLQLLSFDNHLNCPGGGVPIPPTRPCHAFLCCALASLFHLLSILQNLSPVFPIACALFAKNTGVYANSSQNGNARQNIPPLFSASVLPLLQSSVHFL